MESLSLSYYYVHSDIGGFWYNAAVKSLFFDQLVGTQTF